MTAPGDTIHVPEVQCMHCDRTTGSFIRITRQEHDGGHGPDVWVCLAHRPRMGQPRRTVR